MDVSFSSSDGLTADVECEGEYLAASLSTHRESVDRNPSQRALVHRVEQAPNETERARSLQAECEQLHDRVEQLQERAGSHQRAFENGSITGESSAPA